MLECINKECIYNKNNECTSGAIIKQGIECEGRIEPINYEEEYRKLKKENEEKDKYILELQQTINNTRKELEGQSKATTYIENEGIELKNKVFEFKKEINNLNEIIDSKDDKIRELEYLEKENKELKEENLQYEELTIKLRKELEVLKEKLDKEQSESAENFIRWGDAESKVKKLQGESNAFEKMADILKSKGEEKDKLIEEMKSENKNLKEALKKLVEVL